MTAGDKGVALVVDLSKSGYAAPGGSTGSFIAWPGKQWPPQVEPLLLPGVTFSTDGKTATYVTTGTDIVSGGDWNGQVEVDEPGGNRFTSPPGSFYVNHNAKIEVA